MENLLISRSQLLALASFSLLLLAAPAPAAAASAQTGHGRALPGKQTTFDEYIAKPDTNYSYRVVDTVAGKGQTTYILEMTSQAWLTTKEVDQPVWKHWMTIIRPDEVASSKSLLFIGGGANGKPAPKSADNTLVQIALTTKSIVSELKNVPNQPLVFAGEKDGRVEDSLIAYTWDKFLRTGDPKWPARLPMVKSAVRAMDTVTDFCGSSAGGKAKVDGFVVAGASKRGWTTWMTAAMDNRVVSIVPVVIDVLNVEPSMLHHYAAYGFWSPAIGDYTAFSIMEWLGTPQLRALFKIEDTYTYRDRLTMPKFMLNASGDQFFLPDSSQFYLDALPGTKYLRYVPNADHSLRGSDAYQSLLVWYDAVLYGRPLPRFSWTMENDGAIKVTCQDAPREVKLWQATNPNARDFRLDSIGPKWEGTTLRADGKAFIGKVPEPMGGWSAFFVELTFPSGIAVPFKFTTPVRVLPEKLPHKFTPKGPPN